MTSNSKTKLPATGTLVRLKGGRKDFEFFGKDTEGRIILKDPTTGVIYQVAIDQVDWEPTNRVRERM